MSNITCAIWENWQTTKMPNEGSKMMLNSQILLMVKKEDLCKYGMRNRKCLKWYQHQVKSYDSHNFGVKVEIIFQIANYFLMIFFWGGEGDV